MKLSKPYNQIIKELEEERLNNAHWTMKYTKYFKDSLKQFYNIL